jgi:hypothetical protein
MPSRIRMTLAGLGLMAAGLGPAAQAEVYRWQDAQGNPVFSDQPVPQAQRSTVRAPKANPAADSGTHSTDGSAASGSSTKPTGDAAQDRCLKAREILSRTEKAQYLYREGEDGNRIVLTDAEYQQELERLRQMVRSSCNGTP